MGSMKAWKIVRDESSGAEIAEAALVLPIFFMILLGIYWFGMAFNTYATINRAAVAGARVAVANSCASCGNGLAGISAAATQVQQVLQASNLDYTKVKSSSLTAPNACGGGTASCSSNGSDPKIYFCTNVLLQSGTPTAGGPAACGTTVAFQYPYQFFLPFSSLNLQQITLSANAQMKNEF